MLTPQSRLVIAAAALTVACVAQAVDPVGVQNARRHLFDENVNVLTFRSAEQLFPTSRVEPSGATWKLSRAEAPLDFNYEYDGQKRRAEEVIDRTYTNALVIVKHGRIVYEVYRNLSDERTHFISFSMAKSITSMLVGIAVQQGAIHSLDDPITNYVPELKNSAYDGVTIRQALNMSSGADYLETYVPDHPDLLQTAFEQSFVEQRTRFVDYARVMQRAYPPGTHYNYSTFETCVLGWVLERATHESLTRFMTEQLWKPAGFESYGAWMLDGPPGVGREFAGGGFNAVARDYARVGLLMLRMGKAESRQVVPEAWVRESTRPEQRNPVDSDDPGFSYHFQWWPLTDSHAFMARGLQGQNIYVDPDTETVIVKLGFSPPGNTAAFRESLAFLEATSHWEPAGIAAR